MVSSLSVGTQKLSHDYNILTMIPLTTAMQNKQFSSPT